jgi:hypothetical protein
MCLDSSVTHVPGPNLLDRQIKDCLKLSYSSSDGAHGLKWLAKGVGMVKQVHHAADGMTMEYVLQKYER